MTIKENIKFLYALIPLKKHLFNVLKKLYTPPQKFYKHLYFKDIINVPIETESFKIAHHGFQVENDIFWSGLYGRWEPMSLKIWSELCKTSNITIDVGANTGVYALIAKTLNKESKVYAFEPVKRVYEKFKYNIKLNNYDIQSFKLALSNQSGEAVVYDTDSEHTYSVTVNKNLTVNNEKTIKTKIKTIRMDDFIRDFQIPEINLIKIDVETHEPEVLEGMGEYLKKYAPNILIEILNIEVRKKINTLINGINYICFIIDETKGIKKINDIEFNDSIRNYLFLNYKTYNSDEFKSLLHNIEYQ